MRRNNKYQEREATSAEFDHRRLRDIAFLLAGIGIGSGAALLLAPDSGEEVRHALGRRYRKTMKTIGRTTEDLRDRADDLLEYADDLRERGSRLFRQGGENLRRRVA